MDFARKQLEKYGWKEGQGLGKNETGISCPIKPKLKFDKVGIGHSASEEFTNNWWENLYNKASNNVKIVNDKKGSVKIRIAKTDAVEITTKGYSIMDLKKGTEGQYGAFIKTSTLTPTGIIDCDNNNSNLLPIVIIPQPRALTDDELFAACSGRTAHKGARHGLKLSGKLSRIEKQEKLLLKQLKKVSLSDTTSNNQTKSSKKSIEKKLKQIKNHKNKNVIETMNENAFNEKIELSRKQKKSNKDRKRVSFSETVTEYLTQDLESSITSNSNADPETSSHSDSSSRPVTPVLTIMQSKIKDSKEPPDNNDNFLVAEVDEGIDCRDFESKDNNDMSDLQAKIKKENKRMKRKLQKLRVKEKHDSVEEGGEKDTQEVVKIKFWNCIKRKSDNPEEHLPKKLKKERKLEKRLNEVVDSFNHIGISDLEN